MASVNKVTLIGNLGRDPETRYTANNTAIAHLNICTNRRYKDSQGELQEETEWHRVVIFGRQAEVAQQYLRKGNPVYVEGRLRTRKYTDKEGIERYLTEVICEQLQLLGTGRSQSSDAGNGAQAARQSSAGADDGFESPARTKAPAQKTQTAAPAQTANAGYSNRGVSQSTIDDEDIPF